MGTERRRTCMTGYSTRCGNWNIPLGGEAFFEIPIDLVDAILNNAILMVELIYPIISMVMSFVGTAGVSCGGGRSARGGTYVGGIRVGDSSTTVFRLAHPKFSKDNRRLLF